MGDFEALLSMATKTHEKTSSQPSAFKSTQVHINIAILILIKTWIEPYSIIFNIYWMKASINGYRSLPQKKTLKRKNFPTMLKSFLTVEKQMRMQKEKKQTERGMNYRKWGQRAGNLKKL